MLWIRLKPNKLQRKCSCIIIAYIYQPPGADNGSLREYMKTSLDTVLRRSSDRDVILSGYFNQFNYSVLCTHYGYEQLVKTTTLNRAILYKMWSKMSSVYGCPTVLDGVGTSNHKMVLLVPSFFPIFDTGIVQSIVTRRMGSNERMNERTMFTSSLPHAIWEYMYTLPTCEEQFNIFQETMYYLLGTCFPYKTLSGHSTDKPWITDGFLHLIRQQQRARISGDMEQARRLSNLLNRTALNLRHHFNQSKFASLEESSTLDW